MTFLTLSPYLVVGILLAIAAAMAFNSIVRMVRGRPSGSGCSRCSGCSSYSSCAAKDAQASPAGATDEASQASLPGSVNPYGCASCAGCPSASNCAAGKADADRQYRQVSGQARP